MAIRVPFDLIPSSCLREQQSGPAAPSLRHTIRRRQFSSARLAPHKYCAIPKLCCSGSLTRDGKEDGLEPLMSSTSPLLAVMRAVRQTFQQQLPAETARGASVAEIQILLPQGQCCWERSKYADEADAALKAMAEPKSFDYFRDLGVAMASCSYASSASADRLAVAATHVAFLYHLDDLCFDAIARSEAQLLNGIDRRVLLAKVCNVLRALDQPSDICPAETALWELGRRMRRLSTPDWFDAFASAVEDCIFGTAELRSDLRISSVDDLESFTQTRVQSARYVNCAMLVELTNDAMLLPEVRAHPGVQKLTWTAATWGTFVSDIFSFHSEVVAEGGHSFNLIAVLQRIENVPFDQALWRAVQLVNSYTHAFTAIEAELPVWESEAVDSTVRRYVQGLKEFMAGGLHFHITTNHRYRWPPRIS